MEKEEVNQMITEAVTAVIKELTPVITEMSQKITELEAGTVKDKGEGDDDDDFQKVAKDWNTRMSPSKESGYNIQEV